jgi:methylthioribose-1-phosphate isomerase
MRAVDWVNGKLRYIDQTQLPEHEVYIETDRLDVVARAIRRLEIRGAPAIGVAAAFGVLLADTARESGHPTDARVRYLSAIAELASTRPTAVNLFTALKRMRTVVDGSSGEDPADLASALEAEARAIQAEDIRACERLGELGAALLPQGCSVLTHCNAGALATAGDGTALSVVFAAARQGKIIRVFVDETRPLLQGARLTSWELVRAGIPAVLITDSAAGTVLARGLVQAVLVGADRIAANGDAANKVGTYPLAVLARRHGVPFYVVAPVSTVDLSAAAGGDIPIEERAAEEVTHWGGRRVAAEGVSVFSPAFDVTPNELITAIVTDTGVLYPPFDRSLGPLKHNP